MLKYKTENTYGWDADRIANHRRAFFHNFYHPMALTKMLSEFIVAGSISEPKITAGTKEIKIKEDWFTRDACCWTFFSDFFANNFIVDVNAPKRII